MGVTGGGGGWTNNNCNHTPFVPECVPKKNPRKHFLSFECENKKNERKYKFLAVLWLDWQMRNNWDSNGRKWKADEGSSGHLHIACRFSKKKTLSFVFYESRKWLSGRVWCGNLFKNFIKNGFHLLLLLGPSRSKWRRNKIKSAAYEDSSRPRSHAFRHSSHIYTHTHTHGNVTHNWQPKKWRKKSIF